MLWAVRMRAYWAQSYCDSDGCVGRGIVSSPVICVKMISLNAPPLVVSTYPNPPVAYYHKYTDDNISRGLAPLPPDLPPKGEPFLIFNAPQWNDDYIVRPLESLNIKRLYPQHFDRKRELKKVLLSVLATFLDLIEMLVKCPRSAKRNEKLEDVNLLLIHMQHLLNEYRVHQARDAVRAMLEVQRRHTVEVTERLSLHVEKVSEMIAGCAGTATSEQNQKTLAASLRLDTAVLQSQLTELSRNLSQSSSSRNPDEVLMDMVTDTANEAPVLPPPFLTSGVSSSLKSFRDDTEVTTSDPNIKIRRSSSFSSVARDRRFSFSK